MLGKMETLIKQAGAMITHGHAFAVHDKQGHFNLVTDRDIEVQEFLRNGLLSILPNSLFFAEEQENQPLTDASTWIVDPIDGTVNFTRGRSFSAVSIALVVHKKPQLAMVYDPYRQELFTAQTGKGAYLNGQAIHVSNTAFDRALITFGNASYQPQLSRLTMQAALAMQYLAGDLRISGCASLDLSWLACGRTDFFFHPYLSPWDYAAGALLVSEANGRLAVPDEKGSAVGFAHASAIVASNQLCFEPGFNIFSQVFREALS